MTKCIWCNSDCIVPPNASDNQWLINTYAWCTRCQELVPREKNND